MKVEAGWIGWVDWHNDYIPHVGQTLTKIDRDGDGGEYFVLAVDFAGQRLKLEKVAARKDVELEVS